MARFGLRQELRTGLAQQQLLLPRMLQSIEILQLSAVDLEVWLRQAAEENEALVLEEGQAGRAEPALARGTRADSERHDRMLQSQPAPEASLAELVEHQLALHDLEGPALEWVRLLVGAIDPAGYLSADDASLLALAEEAGLVGGPEALERALGVLRGLEPRGLGARNAIEALILQLEPEDPEYDLLCSLLREFLEEIARNRLPSVARAMGLPLGELKRLIGRLGELDPRPVAQLSEGAAPAIHPDVLVEREGDDFRVRLETGGLPAVSIDEGVERLQRDRSQPKSVRAYVRGKLDRARWVITALAQRQSTLLRIALAVFDHQRAFLEHGPGHLAPLRMGQLADEVGLHISTVSRAVAGKYVQTPSGILPLRHFFQARAGSSVAEASDGKGRAPAGKGPPVAVEGGGVARDELREAVRGVIAAEDPCSPLSDDDVARALRRRGTAIARRTIAKYRDELGIPCSYRRRRFE